MGLYIKHLREQIKLTQEELGGKQEGLKTLKELILYSFPIYLM